MISAFSRCTRRDPTSGRCAYRRRSPAIPAPTSVRCLPSRKSVKAFDSTLWVSMQCMCVCVCAWVCVVLCVCCVCALWGSLLSKKAIICIVRFLQCRVLKFLAMRSCSSRAAATLISPAWLCSRRCHRRLSTGTKASGS